MKQPVDESPAIGEVEASFLPEGELRRFVLSAGSDLTAVNARIEGARGMDETRLWLPIEEVSDAEVAAGLRSARPVNSFKAMLMPSRELVARYGKPDLAGPLAGLAGRTLTLVGMRGSECRALGYLDKVMLADPTPDPFYQARRSGTTIISVDCVDPCGSCFCNLLGEKAYAEANFDVNLSPVEGGYVVTAGSEKGAGLMRAGGASLQPASPDRLGQKEEGRRRGAQKLEEQNAEHASTSAEDLAGLFDGSSAEDFWFDELALCVQCGGCTAVCPTCYCFLLHDLDAGSGEFQRVREADSCQFTGYTIMAGPPGTAKPDPRHTHMDKFRRRFAHKFWHDVTVNGMLGCVGCGRCIETCPGAIDLRRVISSIKGARVADA
jgi:sulfhydrogenase subunit beta (sulfur reductase)